MKNNNVIKNLIRLLLIIIIIGVSYKVIFYDVLVIDELMSKFVASIRCDELDFFMKFITSFGNTTTIFILLFVVVFLLIKMIKNKKLAFFFFGSLVLNVLINQLIKALVRRERPINSLIYVGGFSFPSGHSMVSMAFYGMLIYIFYKLMKNNKFKWLVMSLCGLLIILIGFSRIYLGVHYLSDVLVGFSVSLLYLDVFSYFMDKYKVFT